MTGGGEEGDDGERKIVWSRENCCRRFNCILRARCDSGVEFKHPENAKTNRSTQGRMQISKSSHGQPQLPPLCTTRRRAPNSNSFEFPSGGRQDAISRTSAYPDLRFLCSQPLVFAANITSLAKCLLAPQDLPTTNLYLKKDPAESRILYKTHLEFYP